MGYIIQWDSGDGSAYSIIKTITDPSVVSLTMAQPVDLIVTGTKYTFRILAYNSVGTGSPSISISIMPASLPSSPNTPKVTSVSSTSITISWTQNAGTDGGSKIFDYIVYWDNGI